MKILHVLAHAARGGCEKNSYHLIGNTPEFIHEVLVLGGKGPMVNEWRALGIKVMVQNVLHFNFFLFLFKLITVLPQGNYDKIVVWTSIRMPLILFALNKYQPALVFVHFGNPVVNSFITQCRNKLLSLIIPVANSVYLRPVSAFVSTYLQRDRYYRRFPFKVSMKPISTPSAEGKKPEPIQVTSVVKIGMVARLDPIKDHETLIRAFSLLLQAFPLAQLYLVGNGVLRQKLEQLCISLHLTNVNFLGEQSDVSAIVKEWDMFVYSTTLMEGLGGTLPEALVLGVPVVAVDLPMVREWDQSGRFVSYCAAGDAKDMSEKITSLLHDFSRRQQINQFAPLYIRDHFSPRHFSLNYLEP